LFTAVVGWKDGEGWPVGGGCAVDFEEEEVAVVVVEVDVVDDVAVAPVDEGAGPFPSTLFGHR